MYTTNDSTLGTPSKTALEISAATQVPCRTESAAQVMKKVMEYSKTTMAFLMAVFRKKRDKLTSTVVIPVSASFFSSGCFGDGEEFAGVEVDSGFSWAEFVKINWIKTMVHTFTSFLPDYFQQKILRIKTDGIFLFLQLSNPLEQREVQSGTDSSVGR